jgi:hypothetical protein
MLVVQENLIPCRSMNILIENAESLEFLTSTGLWTKNAAKGKSFEGTGMAFDAAKKEPMGRFNIVFYISQTKQFVNLDHGRGTGSGGETRPGSGSALLPQITPEGVPVS